MNDTPVFEPLDDELIVLGLPQPFGRFKEEMDKALELHLLGMSERERSAFFLMAAANLLKNLQIYPEAARSFKHLSSMLFDLEAGKPHPFLQPRIKGRSGPPDSTEVWEIRADISIGVAGVIAAGKQPGAAAKYAAELLGEALDRARRLSRSKPERGKPERIVREWYDRLSSNTKTNGIETEHFNERASAWREHIASLPEPERLREATKFLQDLRKAILSN